jgi:glycosyltransferase involved in cell wall biosynthesis
MSRLSVVIPVYNSSRYLDRCIISIIQQSYSDFEAIFVDDCSTDRSASIVRQFARNDSRIALSVRKKNGGPGAARNTGIAQAKGEYVTFVDSDDFIMPNLFEVLQQATNGGEFDIVETGCQGLDQQDNVLWDYAPSPMIVNDLSKNPENIFLIREWGVTQKLWRRSLFQSDTIFPEKVYWEDIAVVPSLIVNANSLAKVEFVGYNYLQHASSITNTRSAKHVIDLFKAFDYFISHLKRRNLLERYRDVVVKLIENSVRYFIKQTQLQDSSNSPRMAGLTRFCELLAIQYQAGNQIARYLRAAQLEAILGRSSFDNNSHIDGFEGAFDLLIAQALDKHHVS